MENKFVKPFGHAKTCSQVFIRVGPPQTNMGRTTIQYKCPCGRQYWIDWKGDIK